MRTWPLVAPIALVAGTTLSGCIIYEEHFYTDKECTDETCEDVGDPGETTTPRDEPEPEETREFALTENEGLQGETVLTFLVATTPTADVGRVIGVEFERDVEVIATENRGFEMVMVLTIDAEAEPGDSEVFIRTDDDLLHILAEPFRILAVDSTDTGTDTGTTGTDTGTTGTDTGTTGTDTSPTGTGTGTGSTSTTGTTGTIPTGTTTTPTTTDPTTTTTTGTTTTGTSTGTTTTGTSTTGTSTGTTTTGTTSTTTDTTTTGTTSTSTGTTSTGTTSIGDTADTGA